MDLLLVGVCIGVVAMGAAGLILRYIERNDLVQKLDREIRGLGARVIADQGRAQLLEHTARDLFRVLGETRGYIEHRPKAFDDRDRPAIIAQIDAVTFGAELLLSPPVEYPDKDFGGWMSDGKPTFAATLASWRNRTGEPQIPLHSVTREPFRTRAT